mgnify:CR=1 FL=1
MASVNRVYTALKDLVNKDQKGFVSPSIFNSFAGLAQNSIYNRLFDEHRNAMKFRRAGVDPGKSLGKTKFIEEDLSVFHKKAKLSQVNVFNTTVGTNVQVMHSQEDIDRALMSDLSKPSIESPIALMGSDVEVFPNNIKKIELRYYKLPQGLNTLTGAKSVSQPKFGYSTSIPGVELYDLNLSVDFELPEHFFTDIVIEIAQLIGINLRDQAVAQYAAVEKQKEENK